jgi:hypothetical protein
MMKLLCFITYLPSQASTTVGRRLSERRLSERPIIRTAVSSVLTETCTSDTDASAADDESNPDIPTHSEAFTCLDKALLWFEAQDESDAIQLNFLKKIRGLEARKRIGALKQRKLDDFFLNFV